MYIYTYMILYLIEVFKKYSCLIVHLTNQFYPTGATIYGQYVRSTLIYRNILKFTYI